MLTTIDFRWFMGLSKLPGVNSSQVNKRCQGASGVPGWRCRALAKISCKAAEDRTWARTSKLGVCHRPQVLTPGHRQWKNPLDFPETGMCYFAKALLTDMHTIICQLIDDPSKMAQR